MPEKLLTTASCPEKKTDASEVDPGEEDSKSQEAASKTPAVVPTTVPNLAPFLLRPPLTMTQLLYEQQKVIFAQQQQQQQQQTNIISSNGSTNSLSNGIFARRSFTRDSYVTFLDGSVIIERFKKLFDEKCGDFHLSHFFPTNDFQTQFGFYSPLLHSSVEHSSKFHEGSFTHSLFQAFLQLR